MLRMSDWDAKSDRDMQLAVVFEFVLFIKRNDQVVEMSSCWASLDIHLLRKSGVVDLQLQGGSPLRVSTIDAQDVRAERKGWRNVVKKLSSPVRSRLKVEYKSIDKLPSEAKVKKTREKFILRLTWNSSRAPFCSARTLCLSTWLTVNT
jgi:hypothetical protein